MTISRRDILKLGTGIAAAWATGMQSKIGRATMATAEIPIGLELWSVRQQCEKDLPGVLEAVAGMGYDSVEMAHSYYGFDAKAWRDLLDKNGLKSCGMHMGLNALLGDALEQTVKIHEIIGTPYLIVASLPHDKLATLSAIEETGQQFNELAKRLKKHGMRIGYHCHGNDFQKVDGQTAWELFGKHTSDDVILQLDIGNCLGGGGDPIAMLKMFPGRSVSLHIKDHGGKPGFVFGEGKVDWNEVFQICETTGGVKQYIIEEEGSAGPEALEDVRRAIRNYRKLR
jgi:sugar phosphate isomerase/epimerase